MCSSLTQVQLTAQRLKVSELEAQYKLLEVQVEANKAKRSDNHGKKHNQKHSNASYLAS